MPGRCVRAPNTLRKWLSRQPRDKGRSQPPEPIPKPASENEITDSDDEEDTDSADMGEPVGGGSQAWQERYGVTMDDKQRLLKDAMRAEA
jgi:hypothetical protein